VAEGLHYAHELLDERGQPLGIVHRDVNATNIFVTYEGAVKIIDFGLAKAANRASKTAAGIIKGKVAYMSPEQAVGAPIDRRTDIFALGTTLWELSCDRRLFKHADEVETLKRVHAAEVPDPRAVVEGFPPQLARVLMRALERDKERRYPTCAELSRDLDAIACERTPNDLAAFMGEVFGAEKGERQDMQAREVRECPDSRTPDGAARGSMSKTRNVTALSAGEGPSQPAGPAGEGPRQSMGPLASAVFSPPSGPMWPTWPTGLARQVASVNRVRAARLAALATAIVFLCLLACWMAGRAATSPSVFR
jgi:serine/threonine-protein kinase